MRVYNPKSPTRDFTFYLFSFRNSLFRNVALILGLLLTQGVQGQISFDFSTLNFQGQGSISASTSLQFGPDGKLYVSERYGKIKVFTIQRNGPGNYVVTNSETISLVESIPNHNDDGSNSGNNNRQVTGLTVTGTASNPVVYVSSSDPRIGGGGSGGDVNLDTNSGIITRLTKNGNSWTAVDIVRGLPRSEENHATNGMEFTTVNGTDYLIVCSGGFTNAGAPSNNFAYISEYALSAAILSINLTQLEAMSINTDGNSGRQYIYDIPTLDDPTRPNQNGITDPDTPGYNGVDNGDPFGGNDGLNMAMLVPGGPVQIFSPGFRNAYDLALTASGAVYVTDNGANGGWGGYPQNEASPNVNNSYRNGEPGSTGSDGNEAMVNNKDHLQLVTTNINNYSFGSYYGGHPNPVRANTNAGLFTLGNHSSGGSFFRTVPYDPSSGGAAGNPSQALPANWPPVPSSMINTDNADYRNPGDNNPDGQNDNPVTTWSNNTNGLDEYTASNFGGAMQGNLIAGKSGGSLHRVVLQGNGQLASLEQNKFSTGGGNPLGITCQGDNDVFPGSIWVGTFDGRIVVLEPNDFISCLTPNDPGYDPNADYDGDGYTNQDEVDNGTDICSGASQPNDFDSDLVSDLNDLDDDGDGINDQNDPFQLGQPFDFPVINELFSDNLTLGGYLGLGLTGLMNNGAANPNYLNWLDDPNDPNSPVNDIYGGAIGAVTIYQTDGDAFANDQEKAFQYGVNVDQGTGNFVVRSMMMPPFHNHVGTESQGMFIGTGFQDNYIKLVLGVNGLIVQGENGGANIGGLPSGAIGTPTSELELLLAVDPVAGTVQAKYALNGGAVVNLGAPFAVNGALKTAIQQAGTPLAVGLIGTNGGNAEFAANWDYLNVEADVSSDDPFVTQNLPDLIRAMSAPDDQINLDNYFDDNDGVANLTYTVQQNTNPAIGAVIAGNILTLSYPASPASATITIRATDGGGLFVEQSFNVTVSGQPSNVLYRVNAGGLAISAIDGGVDWGEDSQGSNSAYLSDPGSNSTSGFPIQGYDPSVDQSTTPVSIFDSERWDMNGGTEMQYSFPVSQPDNYEVRLYMANGFGGTANPGTRIFSVEVEGQVPTVFQNIDLSDQFGHQIGGMISYVVTVSDGSLDVTFIHDLENTLVNGIEILGGAGTPPSNPIVLSSIANQADEEGDAVNLAVQASGGDGALVYAATGLPAGLTIDAGTGVISGTLATGAATNSPYTVTITVDDSDADNTDVKTSTFTWTVTEPGTGPVSGVLYRVNAGGPAIAAIDGSLDWGLDSQGANSVYLADPGSNTVNAFTMQGYDVSVDQSTVPVSIFETERWDQNGGTEMHYSFPVAQVDNYEVRLYMANGYPGTAATGTRVFSIEVEGAIPAVYQSVDLSDQFGHQIGAMISYTVAVTDGNLDVTFIHGVENPLVNGIEILGGGGTPPSIPIVVDAIANQADEEGDVVNLAVQASGGDGALDYSAIGLPAGLTIDATTGVISGTIATGAANNSPYSVTVSVDDSDADNNDIKTTSFVWVVSEPGAGPVAGVLYRINAGGPAIAAIDGAADWDEDSQAANSAYLSDAGSNTVNGFSMQSYDVSVDQSSVPVSIFETERWDQNGGTEMQYSFPVAQVANYEVRIYMGNGFPGTANMGTRVFSIEIEGVVPTVYQNLDLSDQFGHQVGAMISYPVTVSDGNLDVKFIHAIENPLVNAIEILGGTGTPSTPIVLNPIPNQSDEEGDNANATVVASGGDGNLVYTATNLPPGVTIDPTNGLMGGTILAGASDNSPYTVTITVDDSDADNTDIQTTSFTWIITEPGSGPVAGVLYRVNSGGPAIASIDNEGDWEEDTGNNNSAYLSEPGSNHTSSQNVTSYNASVDQSTTPVDIFKTERSDFSGGAEMEYSFPVTQPGTYEVRMYMGNGYGGTSLPDTRIFSIEVEGYIPFVYHDIDLSDQFGHKVGAMVSYLVNVSDGFLDIKFVHNVENPLVNGIEILGSNQSNQVPVAGFTATPISGIAPLSVDFDATASADADNDPLMYMWDFGDGNMGNGASLSHVFQNVGNFTVTLTVDDGNGGVDQATTLISVTNGGTPCNNGTTTFLSDLNWVSASNGFGPPELDTSNGESQANDGNTMSINGQTYAKGLGVHANSEIIYNLNGQYDRFLSDVGADDETCNLSTVEFKVFADGVLVYTSPILTQADDAQSFDLDVVGVNELKLVVGVGGDNYWCDHANWANARLESNCSNNRNLSEVQMPDFNIYPNPTQTGTFLIEAQTTDLDEEVEVEIWNMSGQLISREKFNTLRMKLNIGLNNPDGLYLIKVNYKEISKSYRIMKQK